LEVEGSKVYGSGFWLRNGFLSQREQLDRINRIVRIMRPSAERRLAAGERIPDNPVNPV
jgi:hypothetical protein